MVIIDYYSIDSPLPLDSIDSPLPLDSIDSPLPLDSIDSPLPLDSIDSLLPSPNLVEILCVGVLSINKGDTGKIDGRVYVVIRGVSGTTIKYDILCCFVFRIGVSGIRNKDGDDVQCVTVFTTQEGEIGASLGLQEGECVVIIIVGVSGTTIKYDILCCFVFRIGVSGIRNKDGDDVQCVTVFTTQEGEYASLLGLQEGAIGACTGRNFVSRTISIFNNASLCVT